MPRVILHGMSPDAPVLDGGWELMISSFPFVVGRTAECCGHLHDPMISRYHCSFFLQGEDVWVQDMNSRNGTYVNGWLARLPHVLRDGDRLRLASREFRVELRPGEADSSGRLLRGGQEAAARAG
jgi:pSer/pThr/pTyr-binding forkhead associated (FHA) protein